MEDDHNPRPPSRPREWVCTKCGMVCSPPRFLTREPMAGERNQIVAPQRPEQPTEACVGPQNRSFFIATPPVVRAELGIVSVPSRQVPDDMPPTFHQFLPLSNDDKAGQKGS